MKQQILSLWENKSKAGKVYYSGEISLGVNGSVKVVCFPNENKQENDNKPSLIGYLQDEKDNLPF